MRQNYEEILFFFFIFRAQSIYLILFLTLAQLYSFISVTIVLGEQRQSMEFFYFPLCRLDGILSYQASPKCLKIIHIF